jgi:A nuclease family of the HNH/ENDO VII superfamily with conserved AHH
MKLFLQILFLLLTWFTSIANSTTIFAKAAMLSYEHSFSNPENATEENIAKIGKQNFARSDIEEQNLSILNPSRESYVKARIARTKDDNILKGAGEINYVDEFVPSVSSISQKISKTFEEIEQLADAGKRMTTKTAKKLSNDGIKITDLDNVISSDKIRIYNNGSPTAGDRDLATPSYLIECKTTLSNRSFTDIKNQIDKMIEGIFVYSDKVETWVREDGKTDFDMYEDALMRKTEPFSWGVHKAASDIGKNIIDLVRDPKEYMASLWQAIKGLKDLDIDQTWERIKNMDETDVSYVISTLLLMKLSGGGKAGSSVLSAGVSISKEGIKYFEEIYRFLGKLKGKNKAFLLIQSITNSQLYNLLRTDASTKLGKALKTIGQLKPAIGYAAHHIIPLELIKDTFVGDFVRKAYDALWEINGANNGIWVKEFKKATETSLEEGQHAFHPKYTQQIKLRIQSFIKEAQRLGKEIDGKMAKEFLEKETERLKKIIEEECVKKGTKINDLTL